MIITFTLCVSCAEKEPTASLEDSRLETQQAILNDTLAQLKSEEAQIEEDAWMYERPRCTKR